MAKKQTNKNLKPYEIFVINMKGLMAMRGVTPDEMVEYMNLSRSTYYKRIREPYRFTMGEMASAAKRLGVDASAMIAKVMDVMEVNMSA